MTAYAIRPTGPASAALSGAHAHVIVGRARILAWEIPSDHPPTSIGVGASHADWLVEAPGVGARHFDILWDGRATWIVERGLPVWVDGVPVGGAMRLDGAHDIRFGAAVMRIEANDPGLFEGVAEGAYYASSDHAPHAQPPCAQASHGSASHASTRATRMLGSSATLAPGTQLDLVSNPGSPSRDTMPSGGPTLRVRTLGEAALAPAAPSGATPDFARTLLVHPGQSGTPGQSPGAPPGMRPRLGEGAIQRAWDDERTVISFAGAPARPSEIHAAPPAPVAPPAAPTASPTAAGAFAPVEPAKRRGLHPAFAAITLVAAAVGAFFFVQRMRSTAHAEELAAAADTAAEVAAAAAASDTAAADTAASDTAASDTAASASETGATEIEGASPDIESTSVETASHESGSLPAPAPSSGAEEAAAIALASQGRFADAAAVYEALASERDEATYEEIARVLRRRVREASR